MDQRLEGRIVLITGAAGAIGGATARRFASEGARLLLADRAESRPDALADEIAATGAARPVVLSYDAASSASSSTLVADAVAAAGGLDVVCNIAGLYAKAHSTDVTDADWDRMLQINLSSVFAISRAAIPHLRRSGGSVTSTSSLAGLKGHPYSTAYAVAKAGIIAMTKSLAAEYIRDGIRFNAICPGGIRSGMSAVAPVPGADPDLAFRRSKLKGCADGLGEPSDIAAAFAYLASDDARFVTGSVLVVDGGQMLL
jgi:NAD(P)-dependent dehydrogenase (short-subunit alcohol dehydrogenase family)